MKRFWLALLCAAVAFGLCGCSWARHEKVYSRKPKAVVTDGGQRTIFRVTLRSGRHRMAVLDESGRLRFVLIGADPGAPGLTLQEEVK